MLLQAIFIARLSEARRSLRWRGRKGEIQQSSSSSNDDSLPVDEVCPPESALLVLKTIDEEAHSENGIDVPRVKTFLKASFTLRSTSPVAVLPAYLLNEELVRQSCTFKPRSLIMLCNVCS